MLHWQRSALCSHRISACEESTQCILIPTPPSPPSPAATAAAVEGRSSEQRTQWASAAEQLSSWSERTTNSFNEGTADKLRIPSSSNTAIPSSERHQERRFMAGLLMTPSSEQSRKADTKRTCPLLRYICHALTIFLVCRQQIWSCCLKRFSARDLALDLQVFHLRMS